MKKEHPNVVKLRCSCTGVVGFLQPILDEYLRDYPTVNLLLRDDSGFATPGL